MGKISVETDRVLKISLPGYNADTATPEQCAVHSGFDYPKIEEDLEGYEEVTLPSSIAPGTTVLKTITHNYGYKPNVLVYIDTLSGGIYGTQFEILPYIFTTPVDMWYDIEVTNTQLKIVLKFADIFGGGTSIYPPAGETVGFKWQVWVND